MAYWAQSYAEKNSACLQAKSGGPESVVMNIYKNYPWSGRKVVINEPKKILLKYFDENLTNLILRNNECEKKTGDICKIDFDIMYAAQDADISNFFICAMASDTKDVEVKFLNFGVLSIIHYQLISTAKGLRISDIIYSDGGSLVKSLPE